MNKYILIVIIAVLFIFILFIILKINKIIRLGNKVKESSSGIDIGLTKRYDVLSKMIEVVKGYVKHEEETFFETVKYRMDMNMDEKAEANNVMTNNFKKINILAENHPELKATENFMALQKSIVDVEEHLQAARRLYNSNVTLYNNLIQTFPTLIIAKLIGAKEKQYFEASTEEKQSIDVIERLTK